MAKIRIYNDHQIKSLQHFIDSKKNLSIQYKKQTLTTLDFNQFLSILWKNDFNEVLHSSENSPIQNAQLLNDEVNLHNNKRNNQKEVSNQIMSNFVSNFKNKTDTEYDYNLELKRTQIEINKAKIRLICTDFIINLK